jgi:hypothetical protein
MCVHDATRPKGERTLCRHGPRLDLDDHRPRIRLRCPETRPAVAVADPRLPFRIRTRCVLWWHECGHRPRSSSGRGEEPEQPFGDVVAYATHVAEQIWPTDRAVNVGLCAGLPGLAVLLRMQALLSGVAGLARGGPAVFSVGMLVV